MHTEPVFGWAGEHESSTGYRRAFMIARCSRIGSRQLWVGTQKKEVVVNRLTYAAIAFLGVILSGATRLAAQDHPALAGSSDNASAAQQIALMRKDIRSMKRQIIAANLDLTDTEATKFWPVYEQYSADVEKINDARVALIGEYKEGRLTLTDEQADSLIRRWLDTDIAASNLRQKYVPIFRKVLPGKTAATFFQLDRRISMMIDLQVTSHIPLVQSQDESIQ